MGVTDIGLDIGIGLDKVFLGEEDHFYFDRPEVNEAFLGFIEMRKKINKPI